jgi:hypothetical protein
MWKFLSSIGSITALFVGGVMAYINNSPVWSYVLWGLASIILIIFCVILFKKSIKRIWTSIFRIRFRSPVFIKNQDANTQTESPLDMNTLSILDIFQRMINKDNGRPDQCVLVRPIRVKLDHIRDIGGPYLVFEFWIYNASVLSIKFDRNPSGHLIYEGHELRDTLEFLPGGLKPTLARTNVANIELRQFLLPELANNIMNMYDLKIKWVQFDFSFINLPIETIKPTGENGIIWRCPFSQYVTFKLPADGTIAFPAG